MKKLIFTFLVSFIAVISYCQNNGASSNLNLDFEVVEKGDPVGWNNFGGGNYNLAIDSTNTKSGKYTASIAFNYGKPNFKAWAYTLPNNYAGKKITLSGYIKTENITEGYAGLWMRIDPSIDFDNMNKNGIKGTTEWTQYEITLVMNPEKIYRNKFVAIVYSKGIPNKIGRSEEHTV